MIVLVVGTGTEVGKTWVTAATARVLKRHGVSVAARKPAQSFAPGDKTTDADELAAATGEDPIAICPAHRRYETPMAPPMAAAALGRASFTVADLVAEITLPSDTVVFVETAGGVRSPIADDGDSVTLAAQLSPTLVVLVADAGLGTINAVRMSIDALKAHDTIVYLNRFRATDELHRRNCRWLETREGLEVVSDPEALAAVIEIATR